MRCLLKRLEIERTAMQLRSASSALAFPWAFFASDRDVRKAFAELDLLLINRLRSRSTACGRRAGGPAFHDLPLLNGARRTGLRVFLPALGIGTFINLRRCHGRERHQRNCNRAR